MIVIFGSLLREVRAPLKRPSGVDQAVHEKKKTTAFKDFVSSSNIFSGLFVLHCEFISRYRVKNDVSERSPLVSLFVFC